MIGDPTVPTPPPADAKAKAAPADRMQRVRVGMTGLASVALVIVVSTAIASGVQRRVTVARAPVATQTANATDAAEPLAQLGAAPGATDVEKAKVPPGR